MILLCAATGFEIRPTTDYLRQRNIGDIEVLITGAGSPATIFSLTKYIISRKPECIIQAGIAGSFKEEIAIGSVVIAGTDRWSDLGIEDNETFIPLSETDFAAEKETAFKDGIITCRQPSLFNLQHLPKVRAITSNTAHGNVRSIKTIIERLNPDIETMEGAACAYVCAMEIIPFLQIRSISNMVEPRCRERWNIPLAIENLNKELIALVSDSKFL